MSNPKYYSPQIKRFLVSALYHEAKSRRIPMTELANTILADGLKNTAGWKVAEDTALIKEATTNYLTQ